MIPVPIIASSPLCESVDWQKRFLRPAQTEPLISYRPRCFPHSRRNLQGTPPCARRRSALVGSDQETAISCHETDLAIVELANSGTAPTNVEQWTASHARGYAVDRKR